MISNIDEVSSMKYHRIKQKSEIGKPTPSGPDVICTKIALICLFLVVVSRIEKISQLKFYIFHTLDLSLDIM